MGTFKLGVGTYKLYEKSNCLFEFIHADWPTFPLCNNSELMLILLCIFDKDVKFYEVDDIDGCKLFQVGGADPKGEVITNKGNIFISISLGTLTKLITNKSITGYAAEILDEYYQGFYENEEDKTYYPMAEYKVLDNSLKVYDSKTHQKISIDSYEEREIFEDLDPEYELETREMPYFPNKIFSVTELGLSLAEDLAKKIDLPENLEPVIKTLIGNEHFDTALRECSVILESKLKLMLAYLLETNLEKNNFYYGSNLIRKVFDEIGRDTLTQSGVALENECYTFFKYIRNEYMHNEKGRFSKSICLGLIFRYSLLKKEIDILFENIKEK